MTCKKKDQLTEANPEMAQMIKLVDKEYVLKKIEKNWSGYLETWKI